MLSVIVWWEMPLSQRLGECRAEQLLPGGKPGPMSWGWWRFPASHQAHLPSVQTALEGVGLGLQMWSRHRFPGNPLLTAPCSKRSPAPPGLALPAGSTPFAQAVCPREPPQVRPAPWRLYTLLSLPTLPSAPTRPCHSAFTLAGTFSSGADCRAVFQPPSPRRPVRASRLIPVSQQVPLFISGRWVSLSVSSSEHLLAAQLPGVYQLGIGSI